MKKVINKFKDGAASFYVVAFSTLILVVVATSFATAIMAEVARTANDDLSQSAYDAALAGIEDAKLAYMNYRNCMKSGNNYVDSLDNTTDSITCQDIVYWMKHGDCDMVAHILGRIGKNESSEVLIEETVSSGGAGNNMNQAYTCVQMAVELSDYQASLSPEDPYQVVRVRLQDGVHASDIKAVRVKWYATPDDSASLNYTNFMEKFGKVAFMPVGNNLAAPPTLAVQLIQTRSGFTFGELNGKSVASETDPRTDRATVYLVPTKNSGAAAADGLGVQEKNYIGVYSSGINLLTASQVASTNNGEKNLPFLVYCPSETSEEFVCSATLQLPNPINGNRSDDTFMFVVSLPYGQPETDFSLEFLDDNGGTIGSNDGTSGSNIVSLGDGMQISVDSTGRANDLYRRVSMRLESTNQAMVYPFYAIELLGDNTVLNKNLTVTSEYSKGSYPSDYNREFGL